MNTEIKLELQEWAMYLRDTMPSPQLRITHHCDENEQHSINIFTSHYQDRTVTATLGLMDMDQSQDANWQLFIELLMDARGDVDCLPEVLSTIALHIMQQGLKIAPGMVFEELLGFFMPGLAVRHILFTDPFQWEQELSKVILGDKTLYPLLAVPITDEENQYLDLHGLDALEERWKATDTDLLNWSRHSAV